MQNVWRSFASLRINMDLNEFIPELSIKTWQLTHPLKSLQRSLRILDYQLSYLFLSQRIKVPDQTWLAYDSLLRKCALISVLNWLLESFLLRYLNAYSIEYALLSAESIRVSQFRLQYKWIPSILRFFVGETQFCVF